MQHIECVEYGDNFDCTFPSLIIWVVESNLFSYGCSQGFERLNGWAIGWQKPLK
jgi:hypothetical protein